MITRDKGCTLPMILASASPRRQELLSSAGLEFEVVPSEAKEVRQEGESPEEYAVRLARTKALQVAKNYRDRWVLAADTIVVIDGKILEKPRDRREAEEMLTMLSQREHRVITGFCIVQFSSGKSREGKVTTWVKFKKLSPEEIRWYLETGEPFDKAGAYGIQGKAAFMIEKVRGSYTNIVGLPLCEVVEAIKELGAVDLFSCR